jgi:hypothetical protein
LLWNLFYLEFNLKKVLFILKKEEEMIKLKKATISTKSIWLGLPTDEQRIFFSNLSELGVTPEDIYQANRDPESLLKVGKKICGLESFLFRV